MRSEPPTPSFAVGDLVKVREEDLKTYWRKPHLRTPGYIFGKVRHFGSSFSFSRIQIGVVERICGSFTDPTLLAYHTQTTPSHLYRVRGSQSY